MKIFCPNLSGCYWRPEEKKNIEKYFNITNDINSADILYWRVNTESVTQNELQKYLSIEKNFKGKVINSMNSFKYTNDKIECFKKWKEHGIPIPEYFEFTNENDFYDKLKKSNITFPFLIRTTDSVTGEDTYLINKNEELHSSLIKLKSKNNRKFCIKFINTSIKDNNNIYYRSYRVIYSCNKIINGYARLGKNWLAITAKFDIGMKNKWLECNIHCNTFLEKNKEIIIKSCQILNLQHVGIDIIENENGDIFFLEVQPFYFCGNKNRTIPPFWNPYKPKELVDWLINDRNHLKKKIPNYYSYWLNKDNHFNECYKQLYDYCNI